MAKSILTKTLHRPKSPNATAVNLCLNYSENQEVLKHILSELTVKTQYEGYQCYFGDDDQCRDVVTVFITRHDTTIRFTFGLSINDGEKLRNGKKSAQGVVDELLYSILCCCSSDYFCPDSFDEYLSEYGYEITSTNEYNRLKSLYKRCVKQSEKLERIFEEEEIEALPR